MQFFRCAANKSIAYCALGRLLSASLEFPDFSEICLAEEFPCFERGSAYQDCCEDQGDPRENREFHVLSLSLSGISFLRWLFYSGELFLSVVMRS